MKKNNIFLLLWLISNFYIPMKPMDTLVKPTIEKSAEFLEKWQIPLAATFFAGTLSYLSYNIYKVTKLPKNSYSAQDLIVSNDELEKIKNTYVSDKSRYKRTNPRDAFIKFYGNAIPKVLKCTGLENKNIRFAWKLNDDFESIIGLYKPESACSESFNNLVYFPMKEECEDQTEDEKKGELAHELIHIKEHHSLVGLLGRLAIIAGVIGSVTLLSELLNSLIKNHNWHGNNHFLPYSICLFDRILQNPFSKLGASLIISPFFTNKLNQYLEKRADLGAACSLKTAQGLITLFEKEQNLSDKYATLNNKNNIEDYVFNRALKKCYWSIRDYILCKNSHPSHKERIAYLKQLQKDELDKK